MQTESEVQRDEIGRSRVLLERELELELVDKMLERVESGSGRALIVRGGRGAGRSSLLSALSERASERGIDGRYIEGAPSESKFPYALVTRLLAPAAFTGADVESLMPVSGKAGPPGAAELGAAVAALHELAAGGAQVLMIDDAQWADFESKSCLEAIVRRLTDLPVLLALAVPDAGPESAAEWLLGAERSAVSRTIRLAPFSVAAVKTMIDSRLETPGTDNFVSACHRVSGGNPFILGELLSMLESSGIDPVDASIFELDAAVPPGVRNFALDRLASLSPDCRSLAEAVTLLGPSSDLLDAADLAGLESGTAERTADKLAAAELLGADGRLEFAQPLVGLAIYEDIRPHRRAAMHRAAAQVLDERSADPREVAEHLCRARPMGDQWVAERLFDAASRARASEADSDAMRYLRRAEGEPPQGGRARLQLELGAMLAEAGDPTANEMLRDALAGLGPAEARARTSIELAADLSYRGREMQALAVLEEALAEPEISAGPARRPVSAMRLILAAYSDPVRRQVGAELADLAARDSRLEASTDRAQIFGFGSELAAIALEKAVSGHPAAEATAAAERAIDQIRASESGMARLGSRIVIALALVWADRPRSAERVLNELIEGSAGSRPGRTACLALALRGMARFRLGALDGAEADARDHLDHDPTGQWAPFRWIAVAVVINCRLAQGDLEGAHLASGLVRMPTAAESLLSEPLRESMALLHLASRDPCATVTEMQASARREDLWEESNGVVPIPWRSRRALAVGMMGDRVEALELARADLATARAAGLARAAGTALHTIALFSDGEERVRLLTEAVEILRSSPAALERAAVHVDLGAELRRQGHRSRARGELRRGLRIARRCGAGALISRATVELEVSGANRKEVAAGAFAELTPSERRVAAMAADGAANRQIAEALYVTVKTVEFHLTHAYRKLGIASRSELAGALGAVDQPGPPSREP